MRLEIRIFDGYWVESGLGTSGGLIRMLDEMCAQNERCRANSCLQAESSRMEKISHKMFVAIMI